MNNENVTPNLPKLLSVKQVKEYLRVGNGKAYQLIKRKDFPSFKIDGTYFIIEDKFIEWMEKQTKKLIYSNSI